MGETGYPSDAYLLSMVAGVFIVIGGFVIFPIGIIGVVIGIFTIYTASTLKTNPKGHDTAGTLIVIFSFLSIIGSLGGLLIGFLLGLIGGILAIQWKPPAASSRQQVMNACSNCGTVVPSGVDFCTNCGTPVQK
ncbi:MAG: zinc ribbon domain-containing protein [Candidatus Thermoplasmatota archaeon]|jgi:hypothetical protein|nr:zinc ribbon domain-containing protein [Candidatus Thermoplasmatota archaeon]MCL5785378.1 zinc ribbon domain-containing protein [Candidatus Thermoplasmatota archaeon]